MGSRKNKKKDKKEKENKKSGKGRKGGKVLNKGNKGGKGKEHNKGGNKGGKKGKSNKGGNKGGSKAREQRKEEETKSMGSLAGIATLRRSGDVVVRMRKATRLLLLLSQLDLFSWRCRRRMGKGRQEQFEQQRP